ncbi:MAG: RidA family protein [Brooklawnia sp.]|jgi:enamine deaminase RidA (YjgF/YER057c/UK114 family)
MLPSERLRTLEIVLPEPGKPLGNYATAKRVGPHVFVSGQLPVDDAGAMITGRLGGGVDLATGQRAARLAVLRALGAAAAAAGHIDELREVIRMTVYVNAAPSFTEHAQVADGASDVLVQIFGDDGLPVRAAVGVASLPRNAAVEVELVVGV